MSATAGLVALLGLALSGELTLTVPAQENNTLPELPLIGISEPQNVAEDTAFELFPADFGYSAAFFETQSFRVESMPSNGYLLLDGVRVSESTLFLEVITTLTEEGTQVRWKSPSTLGFPILEYVPEENFCGEDSLQWSQPIIRRIEATDIESNRISNSETNSVQLQNTFNTKQLTVDCLNDAPVAEDFAVEFPQDTSWYFDMPENAGDNCFSARYSDVDALTQGSLEAWELGGLYLVSEPAHGDLFVYPDQATQYGEAGEAYAWTQGRVIARDDIESMRYIPDAGYTGTDSFEWRAMDYLVEESGRANVPFPTPNPVPERSGRASQHQYSNIATTTLNITPDTPPTVEDIERAVATGENYRFTASDFAEGYRDSENNPVEYFRITSRPTNGTLLFGGSSEIPERLLPNELELLEYIPNTGFSGTDSFEFVAVQGGNELTSQNTGMVTIRIAEAEIESEVPAPVESVVDEEETEALPGLIRTGGRSASLPVSSGLQFLVLSVVWFTKRWRR